MAGTFTCHLITEIIADIRKARFVSAHSSNQKHVDELQAKLLKAKVMLVTVKCLVGNGSRLLHVDISKILQ